MIAAGACVGKYPIQRRLAISAGVMSGIDSWRWRGVPFYIRAGTNLPVTCTEILVRLRPVPTMYKSLDLKPKYFRLRVSPEIVAAFGMNAIAPNTEWESQLVELTFHPELGGGDMDAYERVLTDAMAWRIVDPALKAGTAVVP
ncbi:MAG: glucose-6-phosphate dehydrogenase [candidate division NC10 bacterium]|nr:glucose-6-phosphate dehydrogenase [candidate division NC10 bacterium]